MDILAHGLWGGAVFGRKKGSSWKGAFFWGMVPDLVAFVPAIVAGLLIGDHTSWMRWAPGEADVSRITWYSNHAYLVSHSLVVWALIAVVRWIWVQKFPWEFGAAALHILCDIPLHTIRFFPTPYLWPFRTPLHDGTHWALPPIMLANYVLIIAIYIFIGIRTYYRRQPEAVEVRETP